MKKNILKRLLIVALTASTQLLTSESKAQVLFSDNFETNSASQWAIYSGANGGITNDYYALFNFNYSTQTFRFNGQILNIPAAPNSGGTGTKGLKVAANRNRPSNPRIAAVSLFPKNFNFANNYALRFDLFMDYNGDAAGGGSGSTEYATFGINHLGTKVNWYGTTSSFIAADWPSDGVWFAVDGEGGTGATLGDYAAYVGDPTPGPAFPLVGNVAGFLYDQNVDYNNFNSPISLVLPAPPGQTPGSPGKQWVQVEINQIDGIVTWKMNGYVIASHGNRNSFESGTIMIGYSDPLSGIPNPAAENYAIFDNVRVVDLGVAGALPTIRLTVLDAEAAEPSDTASFLLERIDKDGNPADTTNPLTVNLEITGSALNGIDYQTIPSSITFPAGVQSTNINITPINDGFGEPVETVFVRLLGNTSYDLRDMFSGAFNIADDGDVTSANFESIKPIAYENHRVGKVSAYLSGAPSSDVTINYTLTGTATNGINYVTIPGSQKVLAGATNVIINITPINDGVINTNRTVIFTLATGSGYAIGSSSNTTVTIRDDDLDPASALLFSDNFDSDSSQNWNINKTHQTDRVTFDYDYNVFDGIPAAPNTTNGTTTGLKLEANVEAAVRGGISLSPKNGNFTGDYRLRFDAWINYEGQLAGGGAGSTEWLSAGVGTTGDHPNWDAAGADGIWFDADGDGSSTVAVDYEAFRGTTSLLVGAADVWVGNSQAASSLYYAEFGSETAPQIQIDNGLGLGADQSGTSHRGSLGFAWHDIVVTKKGSNVTWTIDGLPIAIVPTNGVTLSSNVFVGYYDGTADVNPVPAFAFAIIDNLRVESLTVTPPTIPHITSIQIVGGNVVINFTAGAADAPSAFTLESSSAVAGSYTNAGATITGSSGSYQATVAINGATRFYKIKR